MPRPSTHKTVQLDHLSLKQLMDLRDQLDGRIEQLSATATSRPRLVRSIRARPTA